MASTVHRVRLCLALGIAAFVAVMSGCGGSSSTSKSTANAPIRIALDWVPNTNHAGLYVAQAKGWFKEAGLDVTILPYSSVGPDALVAQGKADLGYSFVPALLGSRAGGLKIRAVAAVLAHNLDAAVVLASSPYRRPRDLANARTYLGFGAPAEVPVMQELIRRDGGVPGKLTSRAVNTSAYQDLYHGKGDFSQLFLGWEPFEAASRTPPVKIRVFPVRAALGADGDWPSVILIASESAITARPGPLRRALAVLDRGYHLAAAQPGESARIMETADHALSRQPKLVEGSSRYLATQLLNSDGVWGEMRTDQFAGLAKLLIRTRALRARGGVPVGTIRTADLFTNALLPETK